MLSLFSPNRPCVHTATSYLPVWGIYLLCRAVYLLFILSFIWNTYYNYIWTRCGLYQWNCWPFGELMMRYSVLASRSLGYGDSLIQQKSRPSTVQQGQVVFYRVGQRNNGKGVLIFLVVSSKCVQDNLHAIPEKRQALWILLLMVALSRIFSSWSPYLWIKRLHLTVRLCNAVFTRDTFTWGKLTFLLYCVTFSIVKCIYLT